MTMYDLEFILKQLQLGQIFSGPVIARRFKEIFEILGNMKKVMK